MTRGYFFGNEFFPQTIFLRVTEMLWSLLVVLLILWALGFGFGVVGNLIHLLLVVALVVLVVQVISGRRVV